MFLAQLVEDVGRVKASIVAELARDHFERAGHGADQQLLLAGDAARKVAQVLGQLHFDGAATCVRTQQVRQWEGMKHKIGWSHVLLRSNSFVVFMRLF